MSTELAWAAGLFDGEGCTYLHKASPTKPRIRLQVTQKEPEILFRFHEAVGKGRVRKRPGAYIWTAETAAARFVMSLLWPYLSQPKRAQYEQIRDSVEKAKRRPE